MDLKQPMKILIPIDWSENAQKAFNCEWYTAYSSLANINNRMFTTVMHDVRM